jgi:catechol-2,3-dioxygenase
VVIRFAYTAIQVQDMDASERFYTSILGMRRRTRKKVKETKGEMCVLESGRGVLELNWYQDADLKKGENLDHLAFEVEGVREFSRLIQELKAKKIEVHNYLRTIRWDRFFIQDPDGNWIEIFVRKKPGSAKVPNQT